MFTALMRKLRRRHIMAPAFVLLAGCSAPPPEITPLPVVRSREEALSTARAYAYNGEYALAERLLAAHTIPAEETEGSDARMNSRVLQLRAQIRAQNALTPADGRAAEALAAWAVWESPITADAWIVYAEVRRRAEGYAPFATGLDAREIRRYDGTDAGAPRVLARLPDKDEPAAWMFMRALLDGVEGRTEAAISGLRELRRYGHPCRGSHLVALLLARNGEWQELRRELQILETSTSCAEVRNSPSFHRAKARFALANRQRAAALDALQEALRLDPSNPEAAVELAQLERPGTVIHAASLATDQVARIRRDPFSWTNWAALWEANGAGSADGGAFLALAEQTSREQPYAVPPRLAAALARVRAADFGGAAMALGGVRPDVAASPELSEARLVIALVAGDARAIRAAADAIRPRTGVGVAAETVTGWAAVLRHADLAADHPERREAVATYLDAATARYPGLLFIRAASSAYLGIVLPATADGQRHAITLLEGRTDVLGRGFATLSGRMDTAEAEIDRLNDYGVALAVRVTGLEARVVRQERQIRLTQAQLGSLQGEVGRIRRELPRLEARLTSAIERGDERVLQIVDALSAEVRAHSDELRRMGLNLSALEQGRSAPPRSIMRDVVSIAGAALAFTPGVGWTWNLFGGLMALVGVYMDRTSSLSSVAPALAIGF